MKSNSNQEKKTKENSESTKTEKNGEEKVDDNLRSVRRDILSDNILLVRENRHVKKKNLYLL